MQTNLGLVKIIQGLVQPFTCSKYTPDWQQRAIQLSTISDFYTLRRRENPFTQEETLELNPAFAGHSLLRSKIVDIFDEAYNSSRVGYDFNYQLLSGDEYEAFYKIFQKVDSVEKLAMSSCAHAICHLSPPIDLILALCNVFYEEASHLESISTLLGINQEERPWITKDREKAWNLVSQADTLLSYLFTEHCLYEGEGCIAAAKAVYELRRYGTNSTAYRIAKNIFTQETNHAIMGYFWLKQLDTGNTNEEINRLIKNFIKTEELQDIKTFKGKKQCFTLLLATNYLKTRNFFQIQRLIQDNAINCMLTGTLLLSEKQLFESTRELISSSNG